MENFRERILEQKGREGSNDKIWNNALMHLVEYKDLWEVGYIKNTRHQKEIGFILPEQRKAKGDAEKLEKEIEILSKTDPQLIVFDSNFNHILGNAVVARGFIKRFEDGKYFDKEFPAEKFKTVKEGFGLLKDYVAILVENEDILKEELKSRLGYLERFLDYINCDLPAGASGIINLIKFFNKLEKGISKEEFFKEMEKINRQQKNIINETRLEKSLMIINNKGEEYYKLV